VTPTSRNLCIIYAGLNSISATETTFDLLLKQTNDVSEFEDDEPAVLMGTSFVDTKNGQTKAWEWKLTIEADIGSVTGFNCELEAQGFVTHLFIPHPELNERTPAPALNYDLKLRTDNAMPFSEGPSDKSTDSQQHNLGPHRDTLRAGWNGETSLVGLNHIDFFNVELHARHVPASSTLFLLVAGLLALAVRASYWRNR
jgi:hypothetical protein